MLFNAWRSQMFALSDSEEIMSLSIAVWPQSTNVTDRQTDDRRQTDRPVAIPTHWLTAMSRQKPLHATEANHVRRLSQGHLVAERAALS